MEGKEEMVKSEMIQKGVNEAERGGGKSLIEKIKDFEEKTDLSIYLGTGLYQIAVGLALMLLVSFLIGLPIIMAYPYIHPMLLLILKIFGWFLVTLGVITSIAPLIKLKYGVTSKLYIKIKALLKIGAIITLFLVPIGIFLGLALRSILMEDEEGEPREEKPVARLYFLLLFITGLLHVLIGVALLLLMPMIGSYYDLVYPYLNSDIMRFLYILGWICLIPGAVLLACSFWSKRFGQIESIINEKKSLKAVWILILGSSVFITLVFPIGTFLGLTILQEFYAFKKAETSE